MAFRGRGRGRGYGGGGGGFKYAKQEPFELFPDIELPCIGSVIKEESDKKKGETDQKGKGLTREETLVSTGMRLQIFWKSSAYFLEETVPKKSQSTDIERYSDRTKPRTTVTRDSLSQILVVKRFPQELIGGWKGQQPSRKKVRWNPESDLQKLDFLEKLEQRFQGQEDKGEKEKKEGEDEDEDEEEGEDAEEEPSDDDYYQNDYFDDDEDDYNEVDDGGEDEGIY
ncbi:uncharacterized protein LOC126688495 [Quercus robur]|uniref:DNA-directed RNA polymerase III subunit n=1 Tax=Quercus lobata TaxID=97700 RepID=A0A7N2R6I5_QUELO|nr:glutamic acid-rich protein-like [Quercus lobata]XP_030973780.1 glutamic acid-rich protein-like [Quercus lobata]XP_030973781.1 glutamic acid-rich protein-like [Quercus lobata]XP_050239156.1 uncharacterized protein LOC126688495 [Quercus robur]XP_050239157.1 uncharacterized protein LOC126688495 [Quercus robur]